MEQYILDLIAENNRVIIPNFGAFIVSKEHGISILFNNFLSFNDGLLVNYVAEKKGVDTIIATEEVFEYVDKLKGELDEKGTYEIDKLGTFRKDENGILRFQQADDFADQLANSKEKDSETTEEEKDESPKEESGKKVFVLDVEEDKVVEHNEEATAEEKTEVPDTKEEHKKEPAVSSAIAEEKEESKTFVTNTYAEKMKKERKKNERVILIVAAIVVLAVLAIYFFVFKDTPSKNKLQEVKQEIVKPEIKEPEVTDSMPVEPVVEKPEEIKKEEPAPLLNTAKGQIHIIVGGFKEEDNAIKMVEKLRGQGFENAMMIKKGNMNLVSIDSDKSYSVIEAKQQDVLNNQKLESWLYTIK